MKINTSKQIKFEELVAKLRQKGLVEYADAQRPWHADIDGCWYDDSNPEGHGWTEKEAIEDAVNTLRNMYKDIGEFLADFDKQGGGT
jgi:hypothetical protein